LGLAITTVVTNILIPPPPVQAPMNCNDFHEDEYFWQRLAVGILVGASVDRILSSGLANNIANGLGSLADDIYRGVGYSLDDVARALGNNGSRLATAGGGPLDDGAIAISSRLDDTSSGPFFSSPGEESALPLQGSGGDGKVYQIPGDETISGKPYIGKTKQNLRDRMRGHKDKTKTGQAPENAEVLAENLTDQEMAGVEAILIDEVGIDNLQNKIPGLNMQKAKNQSRIDAGRRVVDQNQSGD
jgi:hypothetical protein